MSSEQLGLMSALGSYHLWPTLAEHFRLVLTQPEQRDVAREVVKVRSLLTGYVFVSAQKGTCSRLNAYDVQAS